MQTFQNIKGKSILFAMVDAIQENKEYLGEIDGLIGDGDHGMNMNKGFSLFKQRFAEKEFSFTEGLDFLGTILFTEIGGSMGPIYGSVLCGMAEAAEGEDNISVSLFGEMLRAGLNSLCEIVEAKVGDKTLVDALAPATETIEKASQTGESFAQALDNMKVAAVQGKDRTKDMVAKFGRSSRLGERSKGVVDAGATSCSIILTAMADAIKELM